MNNSKTSLFLMELIIVILFFSVASAACVQLFFAANQTDISTEQLTHSIVLVQNAAESYIGCDGNLDDVSKLLEGAALSASSSSYEGTVNIFYDEEWNPCGKEGAYYELSLNSTVSDNTKTSGFMGYGTITVNKIIDSANDLIYKQEVNHYIPYRKGAF